MRDVIRIDAAPLRELVAHCRASLPNEACGYLVGEADRVRRFIPVRNVAASPEHFRFDPAEQLEVERSVDTEGVTVVGIAHSHPHADNAPSATDVRDASRFDPLGVWIHVIVAPATGSVRAFRIVRGRVEELLIGR